ncbi:MAG: hypothetical protein AVDCRST_MAG79-1368, partial [uncultured Thermoleophilia bacterium]
GPIDPTPTLAEARPRPVRGAAGVGLPGGRHARGREDHLRARRGAAEPRRAAAPATRDRGADPGPEDAVGGRRAGARPPRRAPVVRRRRAAARR